MAWKKSFPFFVWQSVRFARGWSHFKEIWANRKRWEDSFQAGRNSVVDELPWINFMALECLEKNIRPEFRVFEFGGGGSTLFFCKSVAEVATVEDHADWFKTLTETVAAKGYKNWRGFFVSPEPVTDARTRSHTEPDDYKSSMKSLENWSFEQYASSIDSFPEAYFDLILVDGRARPSCIKHALPRLKTGGLLVVDNTERPHYLAPFKAVLAEKFQILEDRMGPVSYTPDFTRTSIFRKIRE